MQSAQKQPERTSKLKLSAFDPPIALLPSLVAVCLYLMFSAVWIPGLAPRFYDDARCLELILLALVVVQLFLPPVVDLVATSWVYLDKLPRVLIAVFLAGGALSAWNSGFVRFGALEIALNVQLVVLFLVLSGSVRIEKQRNEAALAMALSAGAGLLVLKFWLTYLLYVFEGKDFPWLTPFLDFANVRFFSQYQAYSLLLILLPACLQNLRNSWRVLLYVIAINFWALQWIVSTRAVWAGFVLAVLIVLVFARQGRMIWLRMQVMTMLAGGVVFLIFSRVVASLPTATRVPNAVGSIIQRGSESVMERIALWRSALDFIMAQPLLGVGPGQFGLQTYPMFAAHPHNFPLQMLSEYGLFAGLAGIALMALLVVLAVKTIRAGSPSGPDLSGKSIAAALIMGLTDSLFSGNQIMPHSQILLCVVAAMLVGRMPVHSPELFARNPRSDYRSLKLAFIGIAMLAILTTTILGMAYLRAVKDMGPNVQKGNPHFWNYGRFSAW